MGCLVCGAPVRHVNPAARARGRGRYCSVVCASKIRALQRTTHGHSGGGQSPTYKTWHHMRQRCGNPSDLNFSNYGGRGIAVCDRWESFENFLADMGVRPSGMSLDRIDVNGGYSPDNCRWVSHKKQMQNMRKTFLVTYKGEQMSLQELADKLAIDRYTLRRRVLGLGWPEEHWADPPSHTKRHFRR